MQTCTTRALVMHSQIINREICYRQRGSRNPGEAREPQSRLCFDHVYTINACAFLPTATTLPFPNSENALKITLYLFIQRQRIRRIVCLAPRQQSKQIGPFLYALPWPAYPSVNCRMHPTREGCTHQGPPSAYQGPPSPYTVSST